MLAVDGVFKRFGGLEVLRGCSLAVNEGEIVGLIGPNGAGKTTLFATVAGQHRPDRGEVRFGGRLLNDVAPHLRARAGLARTYQVPRLFGRMSVIENLMVAAPGQTGESLAHLFWSSRRIRDEERAIRERAFEVLKFLKLARLADQPSDSLSGGQKKLVELGRALMLDPSLLLLDEPVAGVNPVLAGEIAAHIRELRRRGKTFLVIGHNMEFMMNLSDRIYVLAQGRVIAEGRPEEVRKNPLVLDAYLGEGLS